MCLHCAPTERDKLLMLQAINILLLRSKEQCNPLEQRTMQPSGAKTMQPSGAKKLLPLPEQSTLLELL
jgi:hypothetical protein